MNLPETKMTALDKMTDEQLAYLANELNVWYSVIIEILIKRGYNIRGDLHEKTALDVFGHLVKMRGGHIDDLVAMSFEERDKAIDELFKDLDVKRRAEIEAFFDAEPEDPSK